MGADDYMLKSLNTGHIDKADKQGTYEWAQES